MSEPIRLYYERTVAEILGISRPDFTFLRKAHLQKKEGWQMRGRDLVLTQPGLDQILVHVKASLNTPNTTLDFTRALVPEPPAEKKGRGIRGRLLLCDRPPDPAAAASDDASELPTFTVTRTYPNQRLLQARTAGGDVVNVQVRNNRNFMPGMTLRARVNAAGKYEMEGRCPRTRGRY